MLLQQQQQLRNQSQVQSTSTTTNQFLIEPNLVQATQSPNESLNTSTQLDQPLLDNNNTIIPEAQQNTTINNSIDTQINAGDNDNTPIGVDDQTIPIELATSALVDSHLNTSSIQNQNLINNQVSDLLVNSGEKKQCAKRGRKAKKQNENNQNDENTNTRSSKRRRKN